MSNGESARMETNAFHPLVLVNWDGSLYPAELNDQINKKSNLTGPLQWVNLLSAIPGAGIDAGGLAVIEWDGESRDAQTQQRIVKLYKWRVPDSQP